MSSPSVLISVDPETGDFTYAPSVLHVSRRDRVTWKTAKNAFPFTVVFPQTPFEDGSVSLRSSGPPLKSPAFAPGAAGVYHYSVAVYVAGRGLGPGKIFLDAGCPDIIVGK